jgi:Sulfotransferase family
MWEIMEVPGFSYDGRTTEVILPNFLIVGASKSGTTSLYHYLKEHPEVYMPESKEPRFFVSSVYTKLSADDPRHSSLKSQTVATFENYMNLFREAHGYKAIGEASVTYLYYFEVAIPKIKRLLGGVKIIIFLRNPIERAFSAYSYLFRDKFEVLGFEECLELEEERKCSNWSSLNLYKSEGLYYQQVKAYLENFDQIKVYLYDDLLKDTLGVVRDVYAFLEIDRTFVPDVRTRYNVSGTPQSQFVHRFLTESNLFKRSAKPVVDLLLPKARRDKIVERLKAKNLHKLELNPKTRERLKNTYREDILMLQDLIHKDLTHWLN